MKKSSNDIVRSLFLMAAMIIIGAGSAFAQSENDYFSLTKNAGTESEIIKYYTTLGDAVNAADVEDKITLLKDYTITVSRDDNVTTDTRGVSINKSITLDLNDHKITRDNKTNDVDDYGGALISINAGATLTLVDNGEDKDKMGSIENIDDYGGWAIVVGNGSTLIAKGVMILTPDRDTVDIDDGCTAEFDDCVIHGKVGINLRGTATITNSDISGGNASAIQVGGYDGSDDVIREGCLTIGDGVYISGFHVVGIDYQFGTVILKALPTFGQNRPTTSSTTRAKTREGEIPYDIGMMPGLSLTFEEGTFEKPDQPMSIYIRDNDRPVDPATYTNPITTNYSKYVKDGDKVINPNDVFKWKENDFTRGFRQNTDEVIFDHAAATVTSYSGTTTSHYDFSEAIAAAKSGYKAAADNGGTEFIPEIKLLDNIDLGSNNYAIGDNSKSWSLTLDLNGHKLSGANYPIFSVNENSSLAITDNSTGDTKGSIVSNYSGISDGDFIHVNGGELTATGITISGGNLMGIDNLKGTVTLTDCTVSGCYGIYSSGTVNISGGKISGCSVAGIYLQTNNNLFTALPTFGTGDDKNVIDIWLANGVMNFSEGSYTAPAQPITIKITIDSANEPTADDLPKQFTTGYADNFKDGNTVIDPATVFAYHDASLKFVIGSNDSGEAAVFATMTFAFAEGQTWMTWCDKYRWIKPSGIDVYEITNVTATEITTTKLTDGVIPAYRPLLLMKNGADGLTAMSIGSPEAPSTGYDATTGTVSQTLTGATVFGATKGVDADATEATYILGRTYMLKSGEFVAVDQFDGVAANRCWLTLSGTPAASRLQIRRGGTTEVSGVKELRPVRDDAWYSITGRRVSKPTRGVYINNGRKILIK